MNPKAKAKRRAGYRKMLASPEYKAARAEAMQRAGNQCEHERDLWADLGHNEARHLRIGKYRCEVREGLHAHHLRYPKSRPVEAKDLLIVCKPHHEYLESQKMHKTRMAS